MFRVQTTVNLGCEQIERVIEVDDIQTLTIEERERLFDIATEPLTIEREEEDSTEPVGWGEATNTTGLIEGLIEATPSSYTQNLVEHGLFEKDFYIKHKLEAIRTLSNTEQYDGYVDALVASLMESLGFEVAKDGGNTSEDN